MRTILALLLLTALSAAAQDHLSDRKKIYEQVIERVAANHIPLANELLATIYQYDIDGDYNRWFYRRPNTETYTEPGIAVNIICVVPIRYKSTLLEYSQAKGLTLDTASLYKQIDLRQMDRLENYTQGARLVPFRKVPLNPSAIGNLFKKHTVAGLSPILFDYPNNLAFVKCHVFTKKNTGQYNGSQLIILQKRGDAWRVLDILPQTQP